MSEIVTSDEGLLCPHCGELRTAMNLHSDRLRTQRVLNDTAHKTLTPDIGVLFQRKQTDSLEDE